MDIWMLRLDLHYRGVIHMIIMVVRNDYRIYGGYLLNRTRYIGESFGTHPAEGTASLTEDWIEQYPKTPRKFNVVTCMT